MPKKIKHELSLRQQLIWLSQFLNLTLQLTVVEIKLRYRRSSLGLLWTLLNPIIFSLILFLVFRAIFKFKTLEQVDFFSYVYSGVILVNFFVQGISQASDQLSAYSHVLSRIKVPIEAFVTAKVLSNMVNLLFATIPLFLYFLASNHEVSKNILGIILPLLAMSFFILSGSLFLTVAFTRFRDLPVLLPNILNLLVYLSPVFYSIEMVGGKTRKLVELNPMVYFLDSFRSSLNIEGKVHYVYLSVSTLLGIFLTILALRFVEKNRGKVVFY